MYTMYNGRKLHTWELLENETIIKEYHYCGYDIKIVSVENDDKQMYYGFSFLDFYPSLHQEKSMAEKEIEDFIDNLELKKIK